MQRLGKNLGGYFGETIDIVQLISSTMNAAYRHGWHFQTILDSHDRPLFALTRPSDSPIANIYISSGIHGDEPAGPMAVNQILEADELPKEFSYWLCPCLNPTGFPRNSRTNDAGIDLNRDYKHFRATEVVAHAKWLLDQPAFDACFCLHEDWESHGFYVYELNPDNQPSLAEAMVRQVAKVCPIDVSPEIEGRPAEAGIIRPNLNPLERPEWPEAFFLYHHKSRLGYTLEAPSDFPLSTRVASLVAAMQAALWTYRDHRLQNS